MEQSTQSAAGAPGIRGRGLAREIILTVAGLAVIFALVSAEAYVIGPLGLCHTTFPTEICRIIAAGL
jgi:hypothetical protein